MASTNTLEPPTNGEMAAYGITAVRSSLEDLERAVARKIVKRIKESVLKCQKQESELLKVKHKLDTTVVDECLTELRSLEAKAVEAATQYYDDSIQDIGGLLSIGENSLVRTCSRRTKPRGGPNLGPAGKSLPTGEESPELDGGVSSNPHARSGTEEDTEEVYSEESHSSRPTGAPESLRTQGRRSYACPV